MDEYFRYMYNGKEVDERMMNSRYEEGKEEGKKNKQMEIAKSMLEKKMNFNFISDLTGLTLEEIN